MNQPDLSPGSLAPAPLLDLRAVLERLGCSRNWLLAHLKKHPLHDAAPTHRRVGKRILFTEADFTRLLETMAPCRSVSSAVPAPPCSTSAAPSADKEFTRAQRLLTRSARKPTAPAERTSCGIVPSTGRKR